MRTTTALRIIPLTRGFVAWVDLEDYEDLSQFNWCANVHPGGNVYAVRRDSVTGKLEYMHRRIAGITGADVDHKVHRAHEMVVDNRRSNLRQATRAQNMYNARKQRKRKTGSGRETSLFKGVWRSSAKLESWCAAVQVNGSSLYLGCFRVEVNAAYAYDLAAVKYHGDHALTNFPVPGSNQWLFGRDRNNEVTP